MALARILVTVAYLMLKNNEPYRHAKPELMATKFTRLRSQTSSEDIAKSIKAKPGLRPAARQGLSIVYEAAGLPPVTTLEELPEGEQRMLQDYRVEELVHELYEPVKPPPKAKR